MANNPYVNKVVYGNDVVMDITDTTAEEGDVISGKTFYKASGAKATGSAVIPDISNCYQTTDTAETDIREDDYFPFYNTSATAKKKSLWSNIVSKLRSLLGTSRNYAKVTAETETINGVTFTVVDSDYIIVNGTATADIDFYLDDGSYTIPFSEGYLSGCPEGGSSSSYCIVMSLSGSSYIDTGKGSRFDISYSSTGLIRTSIKITSGTVISNLKFHPSITPIDALNNRDLTKMISVVELRDYIYPNLSAGDVIRIPSTGTSDIIKSDSFAIPVSSEDIACEEYSVYDGYGTITLSEDYSGVNLQIGFLIIHMV